MQKRPFPVLTVAFATLGAAFVAGVGGSLTQLGPWYRALEQPGWAPPDAAFPIVWTTILALWALSAIVTFPKVRTPDAWRRLLGLHMLSGGLNIGWSLLFFRLHRPDWAFAELLVLWVVLLALMLESRKHARLAPWLLLPYIAWVSFAGLLNYRIVALNGPFG
ncbi:TspO/MBR family protein [Sandaracinobacteroides sp. A072]|uniref:TspO/MBR family protein n=1 Tax=Sandaracinobacteroides sp. A072 TaxID=3461146 RepID=UPI004041D208